jgi:2-succinyl-5-enolpyruvyl-6-hydroxy-3-cyclohexene-1-carboxylate synthase
MDDSTLDFRTVNSMWSSVLVETLVRMGVSYAVVSPGSRSTPIAFALAQHPGVEAIPVLDERSAAFFALGLARQHLRPVVLLCTSGTAGANYYPAIIEACESGAPLIVITADRPPEMRNCASGQTIDQQGLFGHFVNFFHELAVPEANEELLKYLRQTVIHACTRTSVPFIGPVHLNAPFRDPLAPTPDGSTEAFSARIDWAHFFAHIQLAPAVEQLTKVPQFLNDVHGLIVAGPAQPRDPASYAASVGEIARKLGWPILTDALSPARNYVHMIPNQVTTYDAILRNPTTADRLNPEVVLCLGGWPTSKVLRTWLQSSKAPIYLITGRPDNKDGLHGSTRQLPVSMRSLIASLPEATGPNGYQQMWQSYEASARALIDTKLEAELNLFEPKAAWLLARHLPEETPLYVASSMPVRDMEYVWPSQSRRIRPFFNRGANGIDGTLSTAIGVAHDNRSSVLLVGDLALLHDSNGFLLHRKLRGSLTIVLINNNGGGIFEHLPVAKFDPIFEEYFATPQQVDFSGLASAHGVEYTLIQDWHHFRDLISNLPISGIRLLEIQTNRKNDAAQRKQLFAEASQFSEFTDHPY